MKPLTLEETKIKEQMKERCLFMGQYTDEKTKEIFNMLCHLEDFEVQYWELEKKNKKQQEVIDKAIKILNNPWSFESGNKEVDEITHNKKREVIDILKKENRILRENAENNDKIVDKVNWENHLLKRENKQLKENWNKLKEDLRKIRQLTFTKYNKNEWENCLSFNDDILPLIKKMQELEQGSDNGV